MGIFDKPWETCGNFCQDPVTLFVLSAASTAFSVFGAISEGQAAKNEASYQSQIAGQNAETAKQQTRAAVEKQDMERRMRRGTAMASGGASGVGVESFGDVLQMNAQNEALDILTLKSEGLLQQRNFNNDANLANARGKNAVTGSYIKAGSALLGGASKLYTPSSASDLKVPKATKIGSVQTGY